MKVTVKLTINEIKAIHTSFMAMTDEKLNIQLWNKVYDIIEELERHLVSVGNKEKELRERLLKEYSNDVESEECQSQFQVGMELILNKKVDITIDEDSVISIDQFQDIKNVEITGRDFINIRVFCKLISSELNSNKEKSETDL